MIRKVINLKEGSKLTCGARARSVAAREVVGRGNDVGRRGESARECGGAIGAGRVEDASWRAGGESRRARDTGGGVRGRLGVVWAGSGRSGPVWTGPDGSGPGWITWAGLGRPGPARPVWSGSGPAG